MLSHTEAASTNYFPVPPPLAVGNNIVTHPTVSNRMVRAVMLAALGIGLLASGFLLGGRDDPDPAPAVQPSPAIRRDTPTRESVVPAVNVSENSSPAAPTPPTTTELVAKVEQSVALIRGRRSSGSGFLVDGNLVMTNYHVIRTEFVEDIQVEFPAEKGGKVETCTAKLIYADPDMDVAILSVDTRRKQLDLASEYEFRKGDQVVAIGNPGMGSEVIKGAVSKGMVSTEMEIDGQRYYQLSIDIYPGNSGGPVLDQWGNVIGMVTLKSREANTIAFCIPAADLQHALETAIEMTASAKEDARAEHYSRVLFYKLTFASWMYSRCACRIIDACEAVLETDIPLSDAIEFIQGKEDYREDFRAAEAAMSEIGPHSRRLAEDDRLTPLFKENFQQLWTGLVALRDTVQHPRGTFREFLQHCDDLSTSMKRNREAIALQLGIPLN